MTQKTNMEIKIPEKHYITFQVRQHECPLAFMTPWGDDEASKKRMITANNWASGKIKIEPKIVDNNPIVGFKIMHSVDRHSRFNRNIVWRIEDPRGFELEISSGNMESIINECVIERGEIQEQCIWGRQKGINILLPINCDEYQQAVNNTKRTSSILSIKDVKIGNSVILHDGRLVKYLGKFYSVDMDYKNNHYGFYDQTLKISKTKTHFFQYEHDNHIYKETEIFSLSQPKISSIENNSLENIDDIELFSNTSSNKLSFSLMGITQTDIIHRKLSIILEKMNINDILNSQYNESDFFIGELNGEYCITRLYDLNRIKTHGKDILFNVIKIDSFKNNICIEGETIPERNSFFSHKKVKIIIHSNIEDFTWFKPFLIIENIKTNKIIKIGLR